ncbi:MAG: site-specific integrase [Campylobacterales bacterium]|nr:site-specific integrase [Campylobacterales bacterium]
MVASKRYGSKVQLNHLLHGDISYFIVYKVHGKTIFKKVGKKSEGITEAKAIELRNQILSEQRHGIDLSQRSFKHLTFSKLAEVYFMSNEAHNKSNKKYKQMYEKHIEPSFGDVAMAKLDDSLIYELQSLKKADGLSDSTVNIIVKLIKRIVGFGIRRGIIQYSPFKSIKLFKINNTRVRYLSKSEIKKLYELIGDDVVLELFVKVALCTGARANSILSIQKKDINLENKSIILRDFKRNNTYLGYMDQQTFNKVQLHIENFGINGYLVSTDGTASKYQTIYKQLTEIFKIFNHGLAKDDRTNKVVIHTLRHTFASHLAIAGVSIQKIQKLMNHKDIKQTLKYAKLSPDSGRDYVEDLYKGE